MYASCLWPPTEKPWKFNPPPPPDVFSSYAETVPVTRYCAPVSLPTFAAVRLETRPEEPRSCSARTLSSFSRSTTRNLSVDASSFVSMLLRSRPAPPYHHPADVSLVKSATPILGFSAAKADEAKRIEARTIVARRIEVSLQSIREGRIVPATS